MALTPTEEAAATRGVAYNDSRYDASTNPYGMGGTGYQTNWPQGMNDAATLMNATAREAAAAGAAAGTAITATSATSLAIGTGTRSFTASTGKAFVEGMAVKIAYRTDPTKFMVGTVVSYDSGTGAMEASVTAVTGSGTYNSWAVSVILQINGQAIGDLDMSDYILSQAVLKDYAETRTAPAIAANVLTLDLETANVFDVALNANITTLTISNPAASGKACSFTLIFTADGTARSVSWPASVKWAEGSTPSLTSTNGKKDVFSFVTTDGGTSWLGFFAGRNF